MYRNLKFLHMADFFSTGLARGPVTNIRYGLGALQVGGPSGLLDFVLRALRALRPCDPRNDALDSEQTLVLVDRVRAGILVDG